MIVFLDSFFRGSVATHLAFAHIYPWVSYLCEETFLRAMRPGRSRHGKIA